MNLLNGSLNSYHDFQWIQRTVFPVNPWQMTRVFLSTQTFAEELIIRARSRWVNTLLFKEEENIIVQMAVSDRWM